MITPKVLIGCITAEAKNYCQDRFFNQLRNLTYPEQYRDILFVDNSATDKNSKIIRDAGFKVIWIKRKDKNIRELMAESHDTLRQYALLHGFDYLFHNETDVFVGEHLDIIEQLMSHGLSVVSGLYDLGEGLTRRLCVFLIDSLGSINYHYWLEDNEASFCDGTVKAVFHAGLGASLIHKSILKKIQFRASKSDVFFPDMNFAFDCYNSGIGVYADTSLILEHDNITWTNKMGNITDDQITKFFNRTQQFYNNKTK